MELHIFAPYVVALSHDLVMELKARKGSNICFSVVKDSQDKVISLWIGVESIFTPANSMSFQLKENHIRGMHGFSAKQLVYELRLSYGTYRVSDEVIYNRRTQIDWRQVIITDYDKRNWRAVYSCSPKRSVKKGKKNLQDNLENDIFDV